MKEKIKMGYSFETFAVVNGDHYDHFDINPKYASIYGVDSKDNIVKVRCTVKENDLSVHDMYRDKGYDKNCVDYLAYFKYDSQMRIIMPNIKLFNCCFPYGADAACEHDGKRTGTICRLFVEIIGKYEC